MMRHLLLGAMLAVGVAGAQAQIQNGNFEEWENMMGTSVPSPKGYITSNFAVYDGALPSVVEVPGTSGKGIQLTSYTYVDQSSGDTLTESAFLLSGYMDMSSGKIISKFPISSKAVKIKGKYKFKPVNGDEMGIAVVMYNNGNPVGVANLTSGDEVNTYTDFSVDIVYSINTLPDSMSIAIRSSEDMTHEGTMLTLDELELEIEGPNGLETVSLLGAKVFPNPASDVIRIDASELGNDVQYAIVGMNGARVLEGALTEEKLNVTALPNGVYFVELKGDKGKAVSRLVVAH